MVIKNKILNENIQQKYRYLKCWICPGWWEDADFYNEITKEQKSDDNDATLCKKYLPSFYDDKTKLYSDQKGALFVCTINLENGIIFDWPPYISVNFYYKSTDINKFQLIENDKIIYETPKEMGVEYVIGPSFMNDWGDYFCPTVNINGQIENYDKEEMEKSIKKWIDYNRKWLKDPQ